MGILSYQMHTFFIRFKLLGKQFMSFDTFYIGQLFGDHITINGSISIGMYFKQYKKKLRLTQSVIWFRLLLCKLSLKMIQI